MWMKTRRKKTISLLLLLLLLLLSVAPSKDSGNSSGKDSDLKCSQRTEAELGKDVTLDCYCEPRCDVTVGEELKWKFNQKTTVLAYRVTNKIYDTGHQDAQFKGRAHVTSTENLQHGNFPLTISTVSESDEGTYTCHVGSKTCSVELQLKVDKGAREDEKTPGAQGSNTPTTTEQLQQKLGYLGFIALFVPAIIVFVCWKKIKKKCAKSSAGP